MCIRDRHVRSDGAVACEDMRMPLMRRAIGAVSRRMERPELLAAVYPAARQALREDIGISAILAATLASDASYCRCRDQSGPGPAGSRARCAARTTYRL